MTDAEQPIILPFVPEPDLTPTERLELAERMRDDSFWDFDPNEPDPFEDVEATGGTESS